MNSLLPRLKDVRTAAKDYQVHRLGRIRPSVGRVGKVFPKTEQAKGELNEKLDLFCVGLEKEKDSNLNLPALDQDSPHKGSPDPENAVEICLPELPSTHRDRRHGSMSTTPDPPPDFLIQGQSRAPRSSQALCVIPEIPESEAVKTMRAELQPLLGELNEEDIFGSEDDPKSLNRILFVRKMGIYVEVRPRDHVPGICCVPLFHCPRCLDHWTNLGRVPEKCRNKKQLTRGPEILVSYGRQNQARREGNAGEISEELALSPSYYYSNHESDAGSGRFGDSRKPPSSPTGFPDDTTSFERLLIENEKLDDLENLSDERLMELLQKSLSQGRLLNGDEYSRQLAEVLGVGEDQYEDFARVDKNLPPAIENGRGSERSSDVQTNRSSLYETLRELKVTELPSEMKKKLLKLLQAQRARKLVTNKRNSVDQGGFLHGDVEQRTDAEREIEPRRTGSAEVGARQRSRGRRSSWLGPRGAGGARNGVDAAGRVEAWSETDGTPGHFRDDYSSESLFYATDDETPWDPRRRPDVLQYREVQKLRRGKKKNPAVWNKTGQPDTPRPRLGRHSTSVPGDSSSFAYHNEDMDEEDWDLERASEFGSSFAQLSDSRNSIWRKYSRGGSSSHSTASREFSFTGFGDQSRPPSQLSASDMSSRERKGARGAKKEKKDSVKRPGAYHSKLVNTLQFNQGEARPLIGTNNNNNNDNDVMGKQHPSSRESDYDDVTVLDRELPPAVTSYAHTSSAGLSEFGELGDKGVTPRPISSGFQGRERSPDMSLPDIRRSCTPKPQKDRKSTRTEKELGQTELSGDLSPDHALLEELLAESPERSPTELKSFTPSPVRSPPKKSTLFSLYDLRGLHRLPLTNAFSFSYYELPRQHERKNKSIDQASKRIGQKRKGNVRSRSVP